MNKVLVQFQRELWESRASLVRTPVILAGVLMALLVVGIFTTQRHVQDIGAGAWMELKMDGDAVEFSELLFSGDLFQIHPNILTTGLASFQAIFVLILLLIIPFYLLSCLYTDRRDQSILFWKSLPVSETRSVLTKLGTAVFLAPAIYTLAAIVTGTCYILLLLLYGAVALGIPMPGFGTLIFALVSGSVTAVLAWLLLALWYMPLFCWFMLASAVARKTPSIWAMGLPLGTIVLEKWVLGTSYLFTMIATQISSGTTAFSKIIQGSGNDLVGLGLPVGLALSVVFIAASIWLRNNRYEV